jgi:hypothetical protein
LLAAGFSQNTLRDQLEEAKYSAIWQQAPPADQRSWPSTPVVTRAMTADH